MINLGNGKYRSLEQINRVLRLEELLKERIKWTLESPLYDKDNFTPTLDELQSLIEESKK